MNRIKKHIALPCCLILLCISVFILYKKLEEPQKISIVYIPKIQDSSNDFWTNLLSGAHMAAEEYNIDLKVLAPENETDYEGQNQLIKIAVKEKPDAIVLSPISYTESNELLKQIKEEYKIPIVLIDSFALKHLDKDSKIAIVSHVPNSSTAMERENGFREALGKKEELIVEKTYSYSDFQTAYNATKDLIERHPDLTLIAGLNEYSAVGAGKAIKDSGLSEQICVVGFDNSIPAIQLLEEGIFSGIVIQKPFNMGYLGIENTYKILKNQTTDSYIDSGTELITKEDMYTEEGQRTLFSFLNN